jgi:hypothetical protein
MTFLWGNNREDDWDRTAKARRRTIAPAGFHLLSMRIVARRYGVRAAATEAAIRGPCSLPFSMKILLAS